jgi:hypothetical protein
MGGLKAGAEQDVPPQWLYIKEAIHERKGGETVSNQRANSTHSCDCQALGWRATGTKLIHKGGVPWMTKGKWNYCLIL